MLLLVTEDDQVYIVIALDTTIDRFITAGTVEGLSMPPLEGLPPEIDFVDRVIVTDDIALMEPVLITPDRIIQTPEKYALKRVTMDTTYVFAGARIKDAPPSLDHIGFGFATDSLGSKSIDDHLSVVDPYNTETQIRVANLTGTVLFPTEGIRQMLGHLYQFTNDDVEEALGKPSVFLENLEDDGAQLISIGELVPTPQDPTPRLHRFHGEMVSVQGIALGYMVRTEDIPLLQDLPVHLTVKVIGVADLTGAMPIFGISSEDVSGELFGFFRFDLSVYDFGDNQAFAFMIGKEAVPLDPITEVHRAEFGDRVHANLADYVVVETETIEFTSDLVLEQIDLLVPTNEGDPVIMTRHPELTSGDYLRDLVVDGFIMDGELLGLPEELLRENGASTIVVKSESLTFTKGSPPVPTALPTVAPVPTPTSLPVFTLSISLEPDGSGVATTDPPGSVYVVGTKVTLIAVSSPGYVFDHWSGDASGTEPSASIVVGEDMSVIAHFKLASPSF